MITPILKLVAPVALVGGGLAGASWLMATAPEVPPQVPERAIPTVEVQTIERGPRTLTVRGHGEVQPARRVQLVAEIAARVTWVAPELEAGDFVRAGAPLVRMDQTDFELALTTAEARMAQAEAVLLLEEAEAEVAKAEWAEHGEGPPPPLVAREPQLARATADVRAAAAAVDAARRDLERCEVRAPFDARVEARQVTLGSFVAPGTGIAALADSMRAEVQMMIRLDQLAHLGLDLGADPPALPARLEAEIGGVQAAWVAQLTRTGPALSPGNRMAQLTFEVTGPYESTPALVPGTFVRVTVEGRRAEQIAAIPRAALRDDDSVLLVNDQSQLELRRVQVLQRTTDTALIRDGLVDGDRVILTPLVTFAEGMDLRIRDGAE